MNIYKVAEKELAELLGYTGFQVGGKDGDINIPPTWNTAIPAGETQRDVISNWCTDDSGSFKLIVEHSCYPFETSIGEIIASSYGFGNKFVTTISDHPDKATAVRFAVVNSVIRKLQYLKVLNAISN